ncbi:MAG: hypothetical protein ACYSWP_21855 [Planctomycetota bacterium]|jgi:hypothetical protein
MMDIIESLVTVNESNKITRAKVVFVRSTNFVDVVIETQPEKKISCNVMQTSDGSGLRLAAGDTVLVWLPEGDEERGVVLGRIGPSRAAVNKQKETPDEIVIEAKKNLTFKCGDGSITLRKDGKILIKGKDLVSRAKRMNRIKGGAVTIN